MFTRDYVIRSLQMVVRNVEKYDVIRLASNDVLVKILRSAVAHLKNDKLVFSSEIEMEGGGSTWWYVCGECHGAVDEKDKFCRYCGRQLVRDKERPVK